MARQRSHDILNILRNMAARKTPHGAVAAAAIDEIEWLRAKNAALETECFLARYKNGNSGVAWVEDFSGLPSPFNIKWRAHQRLARCWGDD